MNPSSLNLHNAVWRGAWGFAVAGVAGFLVWHFGGRSLSRTVGEPGFYAACALAFILVAGWLLSPLTGSVPSFLKAFVPAFVSYCVIWSVCWFKWGYGLGEWLGAIGGCVAFACVVRSILKSKQALFKATVVLCILHALGYFLSTKFFIELSHGYPLLPGLTKNQTALVGKILYGAAYGFGFGAGIGYLFHSLRRPYASGTVQRISSS